MRAPALTPGQWASLAALAEGRDRHRGAGDLRLVYLARVGFAAYDWHAAPHLRWSITAAGLAHLARRRPARRISFL